MRLAADVAALQSADCALDQGAPEPVVDVDGLRCRRDERSQGTGGGRDHGGVFADRFNSGVEAEPPEHLADIVETATEVASYTRSVAGEQSRRQSGTDLAQASRASPFGQARDEEGDE